MVTKQYVWRVPGGVMQITEVDECYFIDNDRPLQADAIPLVAMTPELCAAIRNMFRALVEASGGTDGWSDGLLTDVELVLEAIGENDNAN